MKRYSYFRHLYTISMIRLKYNYFNFYKSFLKYFVSSVRFQIINLYNHLELY